LAPSTRCSNLSKIEAGKLELNPQTVQLASLINEVIGTAGQLAEQNKNRHRGAAGKAVRGIQPSRCHDGSALRRNGAHSARQSAHALQWRIGVGGREITMHHYSPSPRWLAVPGIGFPQNISVGPNVLGPEHFRDWSFTARCKTANTMLRLN
jgi:signal transduction histidine kinase